MPPCYLEGEPEMLNPSNKLLSDIVAFRTYARYIPNLSRRESVEETINRNMVMHLERFPMLSKDIIKAYSLVHEKLVMPSMRSLQFSGEAIKRNNLRQFNCSFLAIDDPHALAEILYLLLSGTGVGYSIQKRHINQLPTIGRPREDNVFRIHDSIEGWAQAINILSEAYFYSRIKPIFDYSQIRPKGARLSTTGAKAPGPEPLKHMLETVEKKFQGAFGRKLRPIEVHDIACIISDCVLAGGVRRSAMISLFDRDDKEMLTSKSGEWYIQHPYRARANNSVVLHRKDVTKEEFEHIFKITEKSGAGEPGFIWTNNYDMGVNPCAEISLNSNQLCNLTSINQRGIEDKQDFMRRINAATLIGTLQAAYTDFPFVRPKWREQTEKEALLGVSFTGIADTGTMISNEWLSEGAIYAKEVNERFAKKIGINVAARVTCVKPEGTMSTIVGSASGIHARHAKHYIRRIRMSKNDDLAYYLKNTIPELVEDDVSAANTIVVSIPQESPDGAILRSEETAISLLERAMKYNTNWVKPGHTSGDNMHNVSCTVSVKEDEWDKVGEFMWKNRANYTGISLIPYDCGTYKQAPFEECTREKYNELTKVVKIIDLKEVVETEDTTNHRDIVACAGGACEITRV
jgi:ribonucleoside-diphosphate reductase alpha chain